MTPLIPCLSDEVEVPEHWDCDYEECEGGASSTELSYIWSRARPQPRLSCMYLFSSLNFQVIGQLHRAIVDYIVCNTNLINIVVLLLGFRFNLVVFATEYFRPCVML